MNEDICMSFLRSLVPSFGRISISNFYPSLLFSGTGIICVLCEGAGFGLKSEASVFLDGFHHASPDAQLARL